MEHLAKKPKLTYKQLFSYSLVIIGLLIIAMPVLAHSQMATPWSTGTPNAQVEPTISTKTPLIEGINANRVPAGQERWYYYEAGQFQPANFAWVSLTLRYQSEVVIEPAQFNFEVLSKQQVETKLSDQQPLGQGKLSIQSVEQGFTEMFWTARMNGDDAFYVRVFNRSPFDLNYNLEANIEPPAVSGAIPASYSDDSPTAVESPPLNVRQLSWQLTAQAVDGMPADQAARWLQQAQALGWISPQGVPAKPDLSAADPEQLWHLVAQAISGLDGQATTEWLTQADALGWLAVPPGTLKDFNPQPPVTPPNAETNDAPVKPTPPPATPTPYQPVNIYPNNPLEFRFDEVNSGRLSPYGVHWYSLLLSDLDDEMIEDFEITMFTTPSNGFIDSRVNFALFPANQYHIWGRGMTNDMEHFGLGMWLSRDKDDHTGERLWSGSLVDGARYLVKVKNDSPVEVDYYLFAGDIVNAELGNPKLHQMDGSLLDQSVAE